MKCGTWVLWRDARRKGSGKPYRKAIRWYHSDFPRQNVPEEEAKDIVICDGDVTVSIRAFDEPDWGGTTATLEIAYKCSTCGAVIFPHLPQNAEQLSEFVTKAVAAL